MVSSNGGDVGASTSCYGVVSWVRGIAIGGLRKFCCWGSAPQGWPGSAVRVEVTSVGIVGVGWLGGAKVVCRDA